MIACSPPPPTPDGSVGITDGGFFADFDAPSTTSVGNSLLITVTGEGSATEGVGFPPAAGGGEPYFVDG